MLRAAAMALLVLGPLLSHAQTSDNEMRSHLQTFLENFRKDPKAVMNALPTKYDSQGHVVQESSPFSADEIRDNNFMDAKDKVRARITYDPSQLVMAQIDAANEPKSLLEHSHLTNINDLGKSDLQAGAVTNQPWSSDYWATFRGGLAVRYSDDNYENFQSWQEFKPVFTQLIGVNFQDPIKMDDRSPAEKYDLLVGDSNFTFSKWWINHATRSEDSSGDIATWQGICHGWSPASYLIPRPTKTISIKLQDGQVLRFFPDDLKALADALYANNKTASALVGQRCNEKNPAEDANGRIISSACWDINPGSFHTIMLNRMGLDKQSLVMDATYDYEVWNQPIVRYKFKYFNPQTGDTTDTYQQATVSMKNYTADPFKKYRSRNAVSVVGVQMGLTYTVETEPTHTETDSPSNDALRTVEYMYDLELDKNGNIIGGEWYQNAHPDFMWSPLSNSKPLAFGEPAFYFSWNPLTGLPTDQTKDMAVRAAGGGQVLDSIVQKLIEMANE